ncbi:cytochrome P450 [Pholiota conissans]|uniref:Cytochrome P450 n=1 Tax=Pholiota conissans TaxID=109636 RepID=A0A9P5YPU2_9AGAR|nr:cytochrome P450 [Pholiota conissans]
MDDKTSVVLLLLCLSLSFFAYKRATSSDDVSVLQGPRSRSWLYGNMVEFILGVPAGRTEIDWFTKYGNFLKFHACFGGERLMISDPVAIRYMFQNMHLFVKSSKFQLINRLAFGEESLVYAEGDHHQRIRAVMNPMFSAASVRAAAPILEKTAQNLCDEWSSCSGTIVNAYRSLHKTTLFGITEAVMGYDSTTDKEYTSAYEDLLVSVSQRSKAGILTDAIVSFLPQSAGAFLEKYPPPDLKKLLDHRLMALKISQMLLRKRLATFRAGEEPEADLFSTFVRTNEKYKAKMSEDEINAQFGQLMVAGEDTTANSLVWVLYTLARNKDWQDKLRKELETAYAEHGGSGIEYDRLPFLNAVIKEVLRFYTAGSFTERVAATDVVIPLSTPIVTSSAKTLTQVRLRRGRTAIISMTGYNRLTSLWGDDANELNPYRWIDGRELKSGASIGPYANLLTFIGGPRTCLGWRFAVLEIQVVVSHLVRRFSFSLPENVSIQPASAITLVPMDTDGKTQLPLVIERL